MADFELYQKQKIKKLRQLYEEAVRAYKENNKTDYEAGIIEGISRAFDVFIEK